MIEPALKLLSEHYHHINIKEALNLLPDETKLSALMPFFTRIFSESACQRRDGLLIRYLLRSESQRVHEDHIAACSPYVYIDENTLCSKCHRPLRTSAFVRYPDSGQIVHLMCHQKTESAAAASMSMGDVLMGGDQQPFFDSTADYSDQGATPSVSPSLLPGGPTTTSTNPFDDDEPAPGAAVPGASDQLSLLSANTFFDDYSPETGPSVPAAKPTTIKSTNPFDDDSLM